VKTRWELGLGAVRTTYYY